MSCTIDKANETISRIHSGVCVFSLVCGLFVVVVVVFCLFFVVFLFKKVVQSKKFECLCILLSKIPAEMYNLLRGVATGTHHHAVR